MQKIKAITFDIWGTLLRNKSKTYHDNLVKYITRNLGQNFKKTMFTKNQTTEEFYHYFKQVCGYTKLKHLQALIKKQTTKNFTEFSDFQYILPLIKEYKLGIISNSSFITGECLKNWGYTKIFDAIVLSYKVETQKPSKEIFDICANKLKLKPNEILHVGNSYTTDYLGATTSGYQRLLLDRNNKHKDIKERITSLKSLKYYLNKLNKSKK